VVWPRVCFAIGAIDRSSALAAGVTWKSRTTSAPWAGRQSHTTVIDADGAIFVLGGAFYNSNFTYLNDVWKSTDGGADRTRAGSLEGYSVSTRRY
jgi:hypothetical protein